MASEQFVDVSYRGLELGKQAKLSEVGPTTAFIEVGKPMPVGSEIAIGTESGLQLTAQVLRVHEQVAGVEHPGMRVVITRMNDDAATWWEALVDSADPVIPEPAVEATVAAEPVAQAEAEAEADGQAQAEAQAEPEAAVEAAPEQDPEQAAPEAVPENIDDAVTEPHASKKKKKKRPARTMMMSVDEIRAAVAEGGHEAEFDGGAVPEQVDAGDTMRMGSNAVAEAASAEDKAEPAKADDGKDKKKKRKRKRKKKKT